jgi:NAD(P)H-quinone oxidoreductase subunit 5
MLQRLSLLPDWTYINFSAVLLLVLSSLAGWALGANLPLSRTWARPVRMPWKFLQDLLAYDFYIDQIYRVTVVSAVDLISRFSAWFDLTIVDGMVNLVGLASIFSGESLKYSVSGQSQFYLLTILLGISLIGGLLTWWMF